MTVKLGSLKKIDLRQAWAHEAGDFTNWLAEEENLSLLSDEIGIDIKLITTEAGVGNFNSDILAEEEVTGRKIIIENQLEQTNHDHLGKIITYAAGYDAKIVIWIVKEAREEHQQAIDWLNEHSDGEIYFFLIKMELWQISDSDYAPKFQKISEPNDWAKAVKKSTVQGTLSDTKIMQLEFWDKFKEFCQANKSKLKLRSTAPQHWYDISLGSADCHITLTINSQKNLMTCEIYISDSKDLFQYFEQFKPQIEKELGQKLDWQELKGKKASRIKLIIEAEVDNKNKWPEYFSWLKENSEKLYKTFIKYIKKSRT